VDVTVIPEQGNFPAVARALLDAADHPSQVRMVTYPAAGFLVPEDVFRRFEANNPTDADTQETPAPRRRGRPRKAATTEPVKEE
jgi:hypothetical protein